ncbi:hypothetical protein [Bacillus cereus]|uniref:Uncharacterized protein n=1 Tax=Bacillus cereus TaxID=1396 RepID=A0A2B9D3Y8_BACCE|nr:hypothetical protein [Bacillus cereus]PGM87388.1 hypothetical protein CN958_30300 [Bacillus cereus]
MNNHNQSFHGCSCSNNGPSKSMIPNPEYRKDHTRVTELNSYINVTGAGYQEIFPSEDVTLKKWELEIMLTLKNPIL